ncbi:MAG: HAD family phosphatase [Phycisphaerae bacterium]|nr:HAD family phosphatase [Phycisphaerae bacterium]
MSGPRIDLLALDLDGTLLASDKTVSERNARALRRVASDGVAVVLVTARPPRSVRALLRRLALGPGHAVTINYNGALTWDADREEPIEHVPLPADVVRDASRLARRLDPGVAVSVETLDRWLTDRVSEQWRVETQNLGGPDHLGPLEGFVDRDATKLMLLHEPTRLGPIAAAVRAELEGPGRCTLAVSDHHVLQVVAPGVDKGAALRRFCARAGIPAQRVMAIGDAPNDATMVRWAGVGVAVGNAWDELKREARLVLERTNDQDAVAHAVDEILGPTGA